MNQTSSDSKLGFVTSLDYSYGNISNDDGNDTYFDEGEYVARVYGPRFLDPGKAWALSTIYVLILITGLFGNICTCIVIYKNKAMHTATNYYLFSLAVSDVTTLIFVTLHNDEDDKVAAAAAADGDDDEDADDDDADDAADDDEDAADDDSGSAIYTCSSIKLSFS